MNHTKIEWALNPDGTPGYTWNPITGCLNGCDYCYARRLANTRLKKVYLANLRVSTKTSVLSEYADALADPFYPRFWPDRLYQKDSPRLWETKQKAKGIFVCDMSDLFGIGIPEKWTKEILDYIKRCPNDRFYLLTKQPQNLAKFSPFPDNCWVGVTATNDSMFRIASIELMKVNAKVKYISFEPLLDWSDYYAGVLTRVNSLGDRWMKQGGINWLIIGAQSKPYKPPKIEWVKEIIMAAERAGIPYFIKNNLKPLLEKEQSFKGWAMKQEMPK